ncbi:RCC1 domain-containing protein [Plantibacter sp. Mn2098]|uniref:RCC1 domain-containing protein n=1 Tax=Plantibacter sp. Mn2098 TaxID=3395266 RepID=UPI003BD5114C
MRRRLAVVVALTAVLALASGGGVAWAGWSSGASIADSGVTTGSFTPQSKQGAGAWTPWEQLPDAWGASTELPVVDGASVVPGSTVYTEVELRNTGDLDGSASIGAAAVQWAAASELSVVQVAAGVRHSLILTDDGSVYAFGSGADGQLGTGLFAGSSVPVQVRAGAQAGAGGGSGGGTGSTAGTRMLSGIAQVAAGDNVSVAVARDGSVYVWGSGYWGSLGDGSSGDGRRAPVPVRVGGGEQGGTWLGGIVQASVDSWRGTVLVRTADGAVYGWGSGNAVLNGVRTAVPKRLVAGDQGGAYLTGITSVSVDLGFALAVTSDRMPLVWGNRDGNSGEMGNGTTGSTVGSSSAVPKWIPGGAQGGVWLRDVVDVSAGLYLSVVDSSGRAFVWGNGKTLAEAVSVPPVRAVRTGSSAPALFVTTDDRLYAAGSGIQTGTGAADASVTAPITAPIAVAAGVQAPGQAPGPSQPRLAGVRQAAGGSGFGAAVTRDGGLYTWGANALGQLGTGGRVEQLIGEGRTSRDATTADVTLTTTMNVQRSASAAASLAIRDDGANRLQATFRSVDDGRIDLVASVGGVDRVLYSSVGEVGAEVVGLSLTAIGSAVTLIRDGAVVFEGRLTAAEAAALTSTRVSLLVDGASVSQTGITAPAVWPTLGAWVQRGIGGGEAYGGSFGAMRFAFNTGRDIPGSDYRNAVLTWSNASGEHRQVLPLDAWTPSGGASIDGGVAHLPVPGAQLLSPLVRVDAPRVWTLTFETAMTADSPKDALYTGYNAGSYYYDADGTVGVPNNANWLANGYADPVPSERIILAEGWEDLRNWVTDAGAPRVSTSDSAGGVVGDQAAPVRPRRAAVLLYSAYLNPPSCSAAGVSASTRIVDGWDIRIAPGKVVSMAAGAAPERLCLQLGTDLAGVLGVRWPLTAEITK